LTNGKDGVIARSRIHFCEAICEASRIWNDVLVSHKTSSGTPSSSISTPEPSTVCVPVWQLTFAESVTTAVVFIRGTRLPLLSPASASSLGWAVKRMLMVFTPVSGGNIVSSLSGGGAVGGVRSGIGV